MSRRREVIEHAEVDISVRLNVQVHDGRVTVSMRGFYDLPMRASRPRTAAEMAADEVTDEWAHGGIAILDVARDASNGPEVWGAMTNATGALERKLREALTEINKEEK